MTVALVIAIAGTGAAGVTSPSADRRAQGTDARVTAPEKCPSARKAVRFYQRRYTEHREKMGAEIGYEMRVGRNHPAVSCPRYLAQVWKRKAYAARMAFERWYERTYEKWRCIHEHEGSWTDDYAPYWGGLQMTYWFQRTYGREFLERWGTANRWPVWAQLLAAERAWRGDGGSFGQWGTAWRCGL